MNNLLTVKVNEAAQQPIESESRLSFCECSVLNQAIQSTVTPAGPRLCPISRFRKQTCSKWQIVCVASLWAFKPPECPTYQLIWSGILRVSHFLQRFVVSQLSWVEALMQAPLMSSSPSVGLRTGHENLQCMGLGTMLPRSWLLSLGQMALANDVGERTWQQTFVEGRLGWRLYSCAMCQPPTSPRPQPRHKSWHLYPRDRQDWIASPVLLISSHLHFGRGRMRLLNDKGLILLLLLWQRMWSRC